MEAKDKGWSDWEVVDGCTIGYRCARIDGPYECSRGIVSGGDQGTDSVATC